MDNYSEAAFEGLFVGVGLVVVLIYIILLILAIISWIAMAKMVRKAGKPGWSVIVPVYNLWVLSEVAVGKGLLGILCLVPVVNFIATLYLFYKLAESFGASEGLCVVNAICPIIGYFLFGFGNTEYAGPASSII